MSWARDHGKGRQEQRPGHDAQAQQLVSTLEWPRAFRRFECLFNRVEQLPEEIKPGELLDLVDGFDMVSKSCVARCVLVHDERHSTD